jgi:hypothetical protein
VAVFLREERGTPTDMRRTTHSLSSIGVATKLLRNYFPLGLKSGPKNFDVVLAVNNFDPAQVNNIPKHLSDNNSNKRPGFMQRHEMKLKCECCKFQWIRDALAIRCSAHPAVHNQQEIWLQPTWMYGRQQPHNYHRYLNMSRNPRTGHVMARETAKGMNTERRTVGLTTYAMNAEKEKRQLARTVSGLGMFGKRWQTRFPFAT